MLKSFQGRKRSEPLVFWEKMPSHIKIYLFRLGAWAGYILGHVASFYDALLSVCRDGAKKLTIYTRFLPRTYSGYLGCIVMALVCLNYLWCEYSWLTAVLQRYQLIFCKNFYLQIFFFLKSFFSHHQRWTHPPSVNIIYHFFS